MSEDELKAVIDYYVQNSAGRHNSELSEQRRQALEYYYGEPLGNEVAGRSQVVSHDVFEVVEWTLPSLMRVFLAGEHIAVFNPNGPQDEKEAKQATEYTNHVFMERNDGFTILHDFFKDALLQKTGTVKVYWDSTPEIKAEEYTGLTEAEYGALLEDENVMVVSESAYASNEPGADMQQGPVMYYDCKIERTVSSGRPVVENIPPEEFLVTRRARSLDDAEALFHRVKKTVSELREMFPDQKESFWETAMGDEEQEWDEEYLARHENDDTGTDDNAIDSHLNRSLWITEAYLRLDWDNDGIAEMRKVTKLANEIIENIEIEEHPFVSASPIPIPHKHYGLSMADASMDLQKTKTAILRNILDNVYLTNNTRMGVLEGQVNLDDALTSRPGGLIRMKTREALFPIVTPPLPQGTFDLLEYVDRIRDGRTGVTKMNTGLNEATLNNAKAGPMLQQMNASVVRIEMIARLFAEYRGGVKGIFDRLYRLLMRHHDRQDVINVRGEWIDVDPTEWKGRCNSRIKVGLGHGNREQDIVQMGMIADRVAQLRQDPEFAGMVSRENIFNLFTEAMRSIGKKNVQDYITHPDKAPQPQPQQDPKAEAEKIKAQVAIQKEQMQAQRDQQKDQMEQVKMQFDMDLQKDKQLFEREKWNHEREIQLLKMEQDRMEAQIKMAELQVEATQERAVKIGDD